MRHDAARRELELAERGLAASGPRQPSHPPPAAWLGPDRGGPPDTRLALRLRSRPRSPSPPVRGSRIRGSAGAVVPSRDAPLPIGADPAHRARGTDPAPPAAAARNPPTPPPLASVAKAMPRTPPPPTTSAGDAWHSYAASSGDAWSSPAASTWTWPHGAWGGWWDSNAWDSGSWDGGWDRTAWDSGSWDGGWHDAAAPAVDTSKGGGKGRGGKGVGGRHLVTKRGGWMSRVCKLADLVLDGTDEEVQTYAAELWRLLEAEQAKTGELKPWGLKASILLKLITENHPAEAREMARSISWTIGQQLEASSDARELVEDKRSNHNPWD